ncbi:Uncharacterised protein [Mycobacteroides abscessus subsp. abscessus]|nr:Uncharacterised protein [Mycobacteroides abscessus subsp. abscessus]
MAIVEGNYAKSFVGEMLCERRQSSGLDAADAMRHDDDGHGTCGVGHVHPGVPSGQSSRAYAHEISPDFAGGVKRARLTRRCAPAWIGPAASSADNTGSTARTARPLGTSLENAMTLPAPDAR